MWTQDGLWLLGVTCTLEEKKTSSHSAFLSERVFRGCSQDPLWEAELEGLSCPSTSPGCLAPPHAQLLCGPQGHGKQEAHPACGQRTGEIGLGLGETLVLSRKASGTGVVRQGPVPSLPHIGCVAQENSVGFSDLQSPHF